MKRYYYSNWLAKVLLFFSTFHTMQWTEVTMVAGTIIFATVQSLGISPWWTLQVPRFKLLKNVLLILSPKD